MERVGKAMRLIADPLQHEQRLAPARYLDRLTATGDVDLFVPLRQRGDGDLVEQTQRTDHTLRHGELALATVDQQQLWRIGEPARPSPELRERSIPFVEVG